MSSVFLSHNSKDKPWVRLLAQRLISDGVVVWLDEAELNIGDSLIEKIASGIKEMKFVAAILSKNSIESTWVQKEISLAMSKEISGRKVTVLPLLIEKCDLPASLSDKLYADFTNPDNYENEYFKLLRALGVTANPKMEKTNKSVPKALTNKELRPKFESNDLIDIKIIGIVKERTRQDPNYSGLQDYFLQLSSHPPFGWESFFEKERSFPRHSMWREAWIEGDCVVVKCALDELAKYHIKDLKEDVANANRNYINAKAEKERKMQFEREREETKRQERDALLDQLKFD